MQVKILRASSDVPLPQYMTDGSAGMDLQAWLEDPLAIPSGDIVMVPTGIRLAIPVGYEAQVRPRSGLAAKHGVTVLNAPGTIDSDYRGEVKVILINHGRTEFVVKNGERIAQLIFCPVARAQWEDVEMLEVTQRGEGGFGHTGL